MWNDRLAVAALIAAMGSHEDVLDTAEPMLGWVRC